MNISKIFKIHVLLIFCLIISTQLVPASEIKERMKQRLPVIAELKAKGIIGEDNKGYLGFVTGKRDQEAVIAAENEDRKTVYTYFAKQQNTTIDVVESIQAARKAEITAPGEFFQNPDGSWHKK